MFGEGSIALLNLMPVQDCRSPCQKQKHSFKSGAQVIRKERAVGVVPQVPTVYEVLEEMAITVQHTLMDSPTPFCAFNGGSDVFVDVRAPILSLWLH